MQKKYYRAISVFDAKLVMVFGRLRFRQQGNFPYSYYLIIGIIEVDTGYIE